ncbi:uncharacterized protein BDZ99DRAFT_482611 [Mytilinidion resinicola]|uniref:Uncharacterized protein n=1 Tax=Mytilinidion resinicola TaxID=574789 RepID=A0A6A6Y1Q7_9PEZI|nr:uncharacterized protein BDZ99DRAFT_482611 [Mytilinidion resinicola]KAF2802751.1 hypothetical protein BDZ99DRAFT_482611 [Mytilinidion resinicola]
MVRRGKGSPSGSQWDMKTKWYNRQKLPSECPSTILGSFQSLTSCSGYSRRTKGPIKWRFRFMDLSKDIRLMVYERLPNMSDIPSPLNGFTPDVDDCFLRDWTFNTAILATCKQIRDEAQALLKTRMTALHEDSFCLVVQPTSTSRDFAKARDAFSFLGKAIWFTCLEAAKYEWEDDETRGIEDLLTAIDPWMKTFWVKWMHNKGDYMAIQKPMLLFICRFLHAFLERRLLEVELVYDLDIPDYTTEKVRACVTIQTLRTVLGEYFDIKVRMLGTLEQKIELAESMVGHLLRIGPVTVMATALGLFERPIMASNHDEISERLGLEPNVLRIPCRE